MRKILILIWTLLIMTSVGMYQNVFANSNYYLRIYDKTNGKYKEEIEFHLEDAFPGTATMTSTGSKHYQFVFSPADKKLGQHAGIFIFLDALHYCHFNVRKETSRWTSYNYFEPKVTEQKGLSCNFNPVNDNTSDSNNTGTLEIT